LDHAKARLDNRHFHVQETIAWLEQEMEYLAVTGVEDKLQAQVL
jgi:hypothetical protein